MTDNLSKIQYFFADTMPELYLFEQRAPNLFLALERSGRFHPEQLLRKQDQDSLFILCVLLRKMAYWRYVRGNYLWITNALRLLSCHGFFTSQSLSLCIFYYRSLSLCISSSLSLAHTPPVSLACHFLHLPSRTLAQILMCSLPPNLPLSVTHYGVGSGGCGSWCCHWRVTGQLGENMISCRL